MMVKEQGGVNAVEELVKRAQGGDREAFARVVKNWQGLALYLAAGYLSWAEAEDATQVIWTEVWRKLWQVEEPSRFEAWLRTLVLHQCLNLRKARARRQSEVSCTPEAWLALAECTAGNGDSVEEIFERRELARLLSRELDSLPGEYGLLLRLYYLQDRSYKEIAGLTGLSLSTLKWRLHQGRVYLRQRLSLCLAKNYGRYAND